jgi:hypothetical protein
MDYFATPEKKVALNLRVPESLKEQLKLVTELWKVMAEAKGLDPADIDMTYVCLRLLRVGIDGAWAQAGQLAGLDGMPTNEAEMERLKKAILATAKAQATDKPKANR